MLLDSEERKRFIAYCLIQELSYTGTAEQLRKLNVPTAMVQREQKVAEAYGFVAKHLSLVETP